jgi:hypothetical protein
MADRKLCHLAEWAEGDGTLIVLRSTNAPCCHFPFPNSTPSRTHTHTYPALYRLKGETYSSYPEGFSEGGEQDGVAQDVVAVPLPIDDHEFQQYDWYSARETPSYVDVLCNRRSELRYVCVFGQDFCTR